MARRTQTRYGYQPVELTIEQLNAVDMLILGKSDSEAAQAVGVSRQTVGTWRKQPEFLAELNARRKEVWRAQEQRLALLVAQAVDVLESALSSESESIQLKAAAHVLKVAGLYDANIKPEGAETPEAVVKQQEHEALFDFGF